MVKDPQQVIEELEMKYMTGEIKSMSDIFHGVPLENLFEEFSKLPNNLTLNEVCEAMDDSIIDMDDRSFSHSSVATMIDRIYPHWVDLDAVIARDDNLLMVEPEGKHWSVGYNQALARLIALRGTPMRLDHSFLGWEEYEDRAPGDYAVAAFNVKEDFWSEFSGTFVTSHDSFTGMTADIVYASKYSRRVRMQGELGEIIREIT